jgi:NAD(P)-dependent dehydrogenase (short-subunit alcohol dehydrogenase family)
MDMQIAVVTGASSGIGQAAAVRIAERGAAVIATYSSNPDGAAETADAIRRAGGDAVAVRLDVGCSDTFEDFASEVGHVAAERWDRPTIDLLVNNAGFGAAAPFEDTTEELFDRLYRVLLHGPYFLTQRLVPMIADGGSIVNVASTSAIPTGLTPGYTAYSTMKGALIVLTRGLAKELSARHIRVNSVLPGTTRTRIGDDAFERMPELIAPIAAETALGRIGEPDDVGRVIAALLSDDFGWVTGEALEVSGGHRM